MLLRLPMNLLVGLLISDRWDIDLYGILLFLKLVPRPNALSFHGISITNFFHNMWPFWIVVRLKSSYNLFWHVWCQNNVLWSVLSYNNFLPYQLVRCIFTLLALIYCLGYPTVIVLRVNIDDSSLLISVQSDSRIHVIQSSVFLVSWYDNLDRLIITITDDFNWLTMDRFFENTLLTLLSVWYRGKTRDA